MPDTPSQSGQRAACNVLTDQWLDVMGLDANAQVCSPLEALHLASHIRCIAAASPLDLFAAHRFLLTLLYWQADAAGGVLPVRDALLNGNTPQALLEAIKAKAPRFDLFDGKAPFLQDPSARHMKGKSVGYLFAELASGTNIALFHHGDDKCMRVCVRCATIGLLRLVPWTQSGGAGLSPSIHNAPPIVAVASGSNLAITLGLNLISLTGDAGEAKWTGHFKPTDRDAAIPYLEALTWNPRRVHLLSPEEGNVCWRCGQRGVVAVGAIVYQKNDQTKTNKLGNKTVPFAWQDPSAFYTAGSPHTPIKSSNEALAATGRDLDFLLDQEVPPKAAVGEANPGHESWLLIIPCTNPANKKTFDHRQFDLPSLSAEAVRSKLHADVPPGRPHGLDGWAEPRRTGRPGGAAKFVGAAARLLTNADWGVLSAAAYNEMHHSAAAFDLLSGLLWGLRKRKIAGLPSRNVAWLTLKLMAAVPSRARVPHASASFCPLGAMPRRQPDERRGGRPTRSPYPVSFPRGHRLEAALRQVLDHNIRRRMPRQIDWSGLCWGLDRLLD